MWREDLLISRHGAGSKAALRRWPHGHDVLARFEFLGEVAIAKSVAGWSHDVTLADLHGEGHCHLEDDFSDGAVADVLQENARLADILRTVYGACPNESVSYHLPLLASVVYVPCGNVGECGRSAVGISTARGAGRGGHRRVRRWHGRRCSWNGRGNCHHRTVVIPCYDFLRHEDATPDEEAEKDDCAQNDEDPVSGFHFSPFLVELTTFRFLRPKYGANDLCVARGAWHRG